MTKQGGTKGGLLIVLAAGTLIVLAASIRYGAIDFSITDIVAAIRSIFPGQPEATLDQRIFLELRLPRAVLTLLVGASLGVGGTLMQALFSQSYRRTRFGWYVERSGIRVGDVLCSGRALQFWNEPLEPAVGGLHRRHYLDVHGIHAGPFA